MIRRFLPGILVLSLAATGCMLFSHSRSGPRGDAASQIGQASSLAKSGRYADAVEAYRKAIQDHPNEQETALAHYGIAMIYVAVDNQQKDYALSLAKLDEFITQYPNHEMVPDAKNWRHAIKILLEARRENDRLNKNIERLKQLDMRQEQKRMGR